MASKIKEWLKAGDRNTKYFHTSTLIRRRRDIIDSLQDGDGVSVDSKEQLKNIALNFYKVMFTSEPSEGRVLYKRVLS